MAALPQTSESPPSQRIFSFGSSPRWASRSWMRETEWSQMPKQRFAWMLALAFLAASLAQAGTFYVDSTVDEVDALPGDGACATSIGTCTLRAAIQEANALPGEDFIEVPAGDYVLTIPGSGEDDACTGDLDITDDLILTGAGLDETLIDGAGLDRVFDIPWLFDLHSFPVVELEGVTVLGGDAEVGGGISVDSAELSIFDSAVEDNLGSGIDVFLAHSPGFGEHRRRKQL